MATPSSTVHLSDAGLDDRDATVELPRPAQGAPSGDGADEAAAPDISDLYHLPPEPKRPNRPARKSWRDFFHRARPPIPPPPRDEPPGALVVAERDGHVMEPVIDEQPRRAMKALPWGRDFAAAVIHREDTLTAIFGKIDAADSPRVALVIPRGNQELSKALGMRRLRRHVDVTGQDLMIVTHSSSLKARAREVGLATVGNVRAVDFEHYGRSGVHVGGTIVPLPGLGLFLRLTAFAVVIAALASVILLYLPQATVQVFPLIQNVSSTNDLTLSADLAAVNPASGEVPAHRRSLTVSRIIPFPVHGQTTVKGPDGNDQNVPAPTDDDINQAKVFAQQVLMDQGQKTLQERYKTETLFQQSATVSAFDWKSNVKAGEAATVLEINATAQVTMLSADNEALDAVLRQALQGKVDSNQMYLPDTFTAQTISAGNFDKNNNRLQVRVKMTEGTTRSFSVKRLRDAVAGKGKREAQQAVVERVDQVQPAKIKLEPGWAPWLPRFTSRITVMIKQPGADTGSGATPGTTPAPGASATPKPQ